MKAKKQLLLLAIACAPFFASCIKEEPSAPLSKEEAVKALTAIEWDYIAILSDLADEAGLSVQSAFINFGLPPLSIKKRANQQETIQQYPLKAFQPSFAKGGGDDDPDAGFNFNDYKGTWTYTTGWNKTSSEPTDKVVLVIPYGEGGTSTIIYSNYQSKTIGDSTYTSLLNAELKISTQTTPVLSWVYTSSRTLTGSEYKYVYNFGAYTKTKTYSEKGVVGKPASSSSTITLSSVLAKNGEIIFGKSFSIGKTYNPDQTYSYAIDGKFRVTDVVFCWNINYDQTTVLTDPNMYIKVLALTTDKAKVADIIFKPIVKSEYSLYVKFTDGSEEPLGGYLNKLGPDLDDFTWFIRNYGGDK